MAVQPTDLKIFKAASQNGGAITASEASGVDQLFEGGFSAQDSSNGTTEFACAYIKNTSGQTASNVSFYVSSKDTVTGIELRVGPGSSVVNGVEQTTGGPTDAPANVPFTLSEGKLQEVVIGDLAAGEHKAIWFSFDLQAGTPATDFDYSITIDAETGA